MAKKDSRQVNIIATPINTEDVYEYSNADWGTIAFKMPRLALNSEIIAPELSNNCIYFLIGGKGDHKSVYIGQAKKRNAGGSVLKRLREHDSNITERYFNKWTHVVVVTNKNDTWTLDDLNALENAFYQLIPASRNLNGNTPNYGGADFKVYQDKIDQIKAYLGVIGYHLFDEQDNIDNIQVTQILKNYIPVEDLQNGLAKVPEICTPRKTVIDMINLLPADVWNPDTKFIDPACKGGEFLKELYNRLMETESLKAKYPVKEHRMAHILNEQLYGIALSKVSLDRATNELWGLTHNIKIIPNYLNLLKYKADISDKDGNIVTIHDRLREAFGIMKFNVVIGNPPYQESDGSGLDGGSALYDKFMTLGSEIGNKQCMVVPMRWMVQYRVKGISQDWVKSELHCNHYRKICYTENSKDIFIGVDIRGGIIYFLRDNKYTGKCSVYNISDKTTVDRYLAADGIDVFITNSTEESILEKIKCTHKFSRIVGTTNEFGIESNTKTTDKGLTLYRSFGTIDTCGLKDVTKGFDSIPLYKAAIGRTWGNGMKGERLPVPRLLGPNEICTGSLILVGKSDNKLYCENVIKYMQTNMMSLLVGLRKSTHHATREAYDFVPLQDFTSNSDIDWTKSIQDIDMQLYKKYNLTQEEIDYIEKTIRPME